MDRVEKQAIFEAIGELMRDQKSDTEAMIREPLVPKTLMTDTIG